MAALDGAASYSMLRFSHAMLLLVALLAGCVEPWDETRLQARTDAADTCNVEGVLFDQEELPMRNVFLEIHEAAIPPVRTDQWGAFAFRKVPLGEYELHAHEAATPYSQWFACQQILDGLETEVVWLEEPPSTLAATPAPPDLAPTSSRPPWTSLLVIGLLVPGGVVGAAASRTRMARILGTLVSFTRLRRERLLDRPTRRAVYDAIVQRPGMSMSEVSHALGVHISTVAYHLAVLERADMVKTQRIGRRRVITIKATMAGLKGA